MNWDLTRLYKSDEAWQKEYDYLNKVIGSLDQFKGKLQDFDQFKAYYELQKEISEKIMKAYQYAALKSDLNKKDTKNAARVQKMSFLLSKLGKITSFDSPEILSLGKVKVLSFINKDKVLEEYRFSIENLFRKQKHVLDEKSESLLANFNQLNNQGRETYSALAVADKEAKFVTLENGEEIKVTSGNFRSYLADLDQPKDRKKVFEAIFTLYNENKNTFAQIYNTVLQRDIANMKSRDYASSLESYLFANNIPLDVYHNLIDVASNNTDVVKRYYKLRKEHLGLKKHHTYDRFIPLATSKSKFEFDEAKKLFFESISHLSEEFQTKAKSALSDGYVDVYEKDGKRTGAYSWSSINNHPYILLNYDNTLNNVFTVAHEAGHSMHSLFSMESQPVATQNYTIFVAEVASTFNEHNLLDYFINKKNASKEDKIALLQQSIDDILGTFYRQTLFAAYELKAHELAEQGTPITHDALSDIMIDLYKSYYDIDITEEEVKQYVWAYIPHLFYTPFYVYQYATSFAASLKLYELVKEDPKNIDKHISLLKSGGNDYPVEQVKKTGIDLTTKEPFMAVVDRLKTLVDELELALKE
ncbi:MAG: oligoendopeptidase F [Candidatus Izimaplasma sp.]|nr:oligoendopeptidase F [Candidatus Izimaplasma bacterium]